MSEQSRQELMAQCIQDYQESSWVEKGQVLDHLVNWSGYSRKHAIHLLNHRLPVNHRPPVAPGKRRGRSPHYGEAVQSVLVTLWHASNFLCGKRLVPFLPDLVDAMERFGHLSIPGDVREQLLRMSVSTADRLLETEKSRLNRGISTTRPNRHLRKQVALRTHNGWEDVTPGFFEADLVAHCGGRISGSYLYTLDMTDIVTGWTECIALPNRRAQTIKEGVICVRDRLPFKLLGLDTDNGGEFINEILVKFCHDEQIEFTRSRAYRKNDQAHIEERNGSVVRRLVGYDRYDGEEACAALNDLYDVLRLHQNYYQPSMRLESKERDGDHVTKRYDRAQTPLQRLLSSDTLDEDQGDRQRSLFVSLDPIVVLGHLRSSQDRFWTFAWNCAEAGRSVAVLEPVVAPSSEADCGSEADCEATVALVILPEPVALPALVEPLGAITAQNNRAYRQTYKPVDKPAYTGRGSVFASVWGEIDLALHTNPRLSVPQIMGELQRRYPGQYSDSNLRTLHRRIHDWRAAHPEYAQMNMPGSPSRGPLAWATSIAVRPGLCDDIGFVTIWDEITPALRQDPTICISGLFSAIQQRYPGRFHDGQIGAFRRCVADWRGEHPAYAKPSKTKSKNMQRAAALLEQA